MKELPIGKGRIGKVRNKADLSSVHSGKDSSGRGMPDLAEKKDVPLSKRISSMGMPEKVRLALMGDKDARSLLARDRNKLILQYLLQNPRLTEKEIIQIAKGKTVPEEVLVSISKKRDWMKRYPIRLVLVQNPKMPLPRALRLLQTIRALDLRKISRSKDVSAHLASGARKLLVQKGLL